MYKLVVCIFACTCVEKYIEQVRAIQRTWGAQVKNNYSVHCVFFAGESKGPDDIYKSGWDANIIHLSGVKDDYESCSEKQWQGLKYIFDNIETEFVHVCGTDTFLLIDNILRILSEYDPDQPLYIGGHGCYRSVHGVRTYFHSGGPGFILSRAALRALAPHLNEAHATFKHALLPNEQDLYTACDVAMGWYATKHSIKTVRIDDHRFFHCNYLGFPCHVGVPRTDTMLACHLMEPNLMDQLFSIIGGDNAPA